MELNARVKARRRGEFKIYIPWISLRALYVQELRGNPRSRANPQQCLIVFDDGSQPQCSSLYADCLNSWSGPFYRSVRYSNREVLTKKKESEYRRTKLKIIGTAYPRSVCDESRQTTREYWFLLRCVSHTRIWCNMYPYKYNLIIIYNWL